MHDEMTIDSATAAITPSSHTLDTTLVPRDRGILIEMSGNSAGRAHRLHDDILTVGRGGQCTLTFKDTTLSRTHARIRKQGGRFLLEDSGSLNGTFVNGERTTSRLLTDGDRLRLGSGVRLQFQMVSREEERVLVNMYEAAVRDGLTGLANRRALDERLASEFAHAIRHQRELCALLIDVDHFKRVNDTHGHLAGDEVLRTISAVLAEAVRSEDLVARFGGEEFIVIAREIPVHGARCMAERLRRTIGDRPVPFEDHVIAVTASIGVSALSRLGDEPCVERLLTAADAALYRAKETGRNRVVVDGEG